MKCVLNSHLQVYSASLRMVAVPLAVLCVLNLISFISFCISKHSGVNIALNKPVFSSSVKSHFSANLANDGNLETDIIVGNIPKCFHSTGEENPWWAVDLSLPVKVYRVDFTSRGDCCAHWANNFIIGLTNANPSVSPPTLWDYDLCGQYLGNLSNGETIPVHCGPDVGNFTHRYVLVQLPSTGWLNICELQVFARDPGNRLDNFVVGLTNDSPVTTLPIFKSSYTVCAQYNASVAPLEEITVVCAPPSHKFRYVIVHSGRMIEQALCLAEVAVYIRSYNLVLNKRTSQISTDGDKVASQAADSKTDTESCTQDVDEYPWWAVDLAAAFDVGRVTVINSANANVASHLDNFVVGLLNKDPATIDLCFKCPFAVCAQYNGSVAAHHSVSVNCTPSSQKFRFVIVQGSHERAEAICLAEVAVFARNVQMSKDSMTVSPLKNLALNKRAFQLSTHIILSADLAVDSLVGSQSCTVNHRRGIHPWWAVDLGEAYDVGHVIVTVGRGMTVVDRFGSRLKAQVDAAEQLRWNSLLIVITVLSLCTGSLL